MIKGWFIIIKGTMDTIEYSHAVDACEIERSSKPLQEKMKELKRIRRRARWEKHKEKIKKVVNKPMRFFKKLL